MSNHVKETRLAAEMSATAAAALAGVAVGTWRAFELCPEGGVTPQRRVKCEAAIAKMAAMATLKKAS